MLDILAGMLCGTLMGLIASAHAAVMLTARPPRVIQQRIEEGGSSNLVTVIVFGLVVVWTMLECSRHSSRMWCCLMLRQ